MIAFDTISSVRRTNSALAAAFLFVVSASTAHADIHPTYSEVHSRVGVVLQDEDYSQGDAQRDDQSSTLHMLSAHVYAGGSLGGGTLTAEGDVTASWVSASRGDVQMSYDVVRDRVTGTFSLDLEADPAWRYVFWSDEPTELLLSWTNSDGAWDMAGFIVRVNGSAVATQVHHDPNDSVVVPIAAGTTYDVRVEYGFGSSGSSSGYHLYRYDDQIDLHWSLGTVSATPDAVLPADVACHPNPFNAGTTISYRLDEPAVVEFAIFDVAGREVRALASPAMQAPGPHTIRWDGRDDAGRALASGVYLLRIGSGAAAAPLRMVLLK